MEATSESETALTQDCEAVRLVDELKQALERNDREAVSKCRDALGSRVHELPARAAVDGLLLLAEASRRAFAYADAMTRVMQATQVSEAHGDGLGQARAHVERARILNRLGLFAEAASASYLALRLADGEPATSARALGALGDSQQMMSTADEVSASFGSMLTRAEQARDLELQAQAYRGLCAAELIAYQRTLRASGESSTDDLADKLVKAQSLAAKAAHLSDQAKSASGAYLGRYLHASVQVKRRQFADARFELEALLDSLDGHNSWYRPAVLFQLAEIALADNQISTALSHAEQAFEMAQRLGDRREAMDCCHLLCRIHEAADSFALALSWHRRFHDLYVEVASETARAQAAATAVKEEADRAKALAQAASTRARMLEQDNSLLAQEAEQFRRASLEDGLTGVANRRSFDEQLNALLSRQSEDVSLALLDIDNFKRINDSCSHVVGDDVLRRVASVLKRSSRSRDLVCRFGGEEFAILFSEPTAVDVLAACERIRQAVEDEPWSSIHPELNVTISIGVCSFNETRRSASDLVSLADRRLYDAKRLGKNRVIGPQERVTPSTRKDDAPGA